MSALNGDLNSPGMLASVFSEQVSALNGDLNSPGMLVSVFSEQ